MNSQSNPESQIKTHGSKTIKVGLLGFSSAEIIKFSVIFNITRPADKRRYTVNRDFEGNTRNDVDMVIVNTDLDVAVKQKETFCQAHPHVAVITRGRQLSANHLQGMLLATRVYRVLDNAAISPKMTSPTLTQEQKAATPHPLQEKQNKPVPPVNVATPLKVATPKAATKKTPQPTQETQNKTVQPETAKPADAKPIEAKQTVFPAKEKPVKLASVAQQARPETAPKQEVKPEFRVLVVDDSPLMQKAVEQELVMTDIPLEIDFAEDGEHALIKVDEKRYDFIFMDVMMPEMDGYEACTHIRKRTDMKKTPIIMLTSKTSPLDEVKGVMAGCTTYITKPVKHDDFQKLLKRIMKWLSNFK